MSLINKTCRFSSYCATGDDGLSTTSINSFGLTLTALVFKMSSFKISVLNQDTMKFYCHQIWSFYFFFNMTLGHLFWLNGSSKMNPINNRNIEQQANPASVVIGN